MQVVCFAVGPHRCALDVMRVREVVNLQPLTPLPRASALIEGVVELRGAFLPVIDLRRRLGLPATPLTAAGKHLVVSIAGTRIALAVDAVFEVRRWTADEIRPAPPVSVVGDGGVAGVVKRGEEVVLLLDLDRILDAAELAENLPR